MGRLADVTKAHAFAPEALVRASARVEGHDAADAKLKTRRLRKRQTAPEGSYEAAGVAKPRSGRGLSASQVAAALADRPLPRRVRAKVLRAVNALMTGRGEPVLGSAALFAGLPARAASVVAKPRS